MAYVPPSGSAVALVLYDDSPRSADLNFDPGASVAFVLATAVDALASVSAASVRPARSAAILAPAADAVASVAGAYDPNVWRGTPRYRILLLFVEQSTTINTNKNTDREPPP